jgi:replicative DNA helicase
VSENSRNLKLMAMDFNLPILVLSQVDRASVKGDGEIGLHSAKEAGDIENDADVLLWIKAKELARKEPTPVSIVVGKQREGGAGFGINMEFHPLSQTFIEPEGVPDE